jgi:D-alanyl-D-alanine carboxypeptidase (penicillin-binding protein 5/6)
VTIGVGLLVVAVVVFVVVQLLRAVPPPSLTGGGSRTTTVPGSIAGLPLPSGAQTSIAVEGAGTVTTTAAERPNPIASVTKLMSALLILRDHPLANGAQGPTITITPNDVAQYRSELAAQDSVVAVVAGERLTERQALEAALIPSADNVIRLLARWDAGSVTAFVAKMNAEARRLGLASTRYAGPSGVNPATVSTASDQLRLAQLAMANPTLAQIVSMPQVVLPVAGLQYNVNGDLGRNGIVGVKTGWVPAGGASFVFAARHRVAGGDQVVIGAIVGERQTPALPTALAYGRRLASAVASKLETVDVVRPGQQLATLRTGTGATVPVVTAGTARLLAWPGAAVQERVERVTALRLPLADHAVVGHLVVRLGAEQRVVPLELTGPAGAPTLSWRLTRL